MLGGFAGLAVCRGNDVSLFLRIRAITARTSTRPLREIVMEFRLIPMGDKPKNKPTSPSKPKLKATESTSISTISMLFLPVKSIVTKQ
jgi:hypothetical protein